LGAGIMAKLPANARQDSEERFARLKEQLRAHDIGGLLSVQSVPLVERLLGDLLESRERCRTAETNYDHARKEYLSAEQQLQPLKDDNTRLMHENNALHLELIHEAERKDEQNRKLILGLEKLRAEKSDLLFLNAQFQLQVTEAEKRAEGLQDSLAKLTDSMAPAHHRESRISVSQRLAEPVPGEQAQSDTRIAEQQDLLKIKDVKIARLQAAEEELSTLKAALETDLTAVVEKLSRRDEEIERLSKLLDGGQDYQKLSFDHVNRTNQQLVSNLNDQVKFLTSQIVNLENEVLHRQGLHEEAEKQHMDLAVKHKSEQAELHDSRVRVQELESEVAQLRHELALTSAETHDTEVERLAKQKLESGLRAQSMSSIQDGAEGGGSAAAGGGGGSATAEISRLRLAG
jgi:centrosomal protein CEP135